MLEVFKSKHLQAYEKIMLKNYRLRTNNQGRPSKRSVWQKTSILQQSKRLQEMDSSSQERNPDQK